MFFWSDVVMEMLKNPSAEMLTSISGKPKHFPYRNQLRRAENQFLVGKSPCQVGLGSFA